MVNEKRVKLMTRLALYEQTQGKEDFKINEYYRKDYVGMHLLLSFLFVTVGYALVVGLILLAGFQTILDDLSTGLIIAIGTTAVLGYIGVLVAYLIMAGIVFTTKHNRATRRIDAYNQNLGKLMRMYRRESK